MEVEKDRNTKRKVEWYILELERRKKREERKKKGIETKWPEWTAEQRLT